VCTASGDRTCHVWKVPVAIQARMAQQTTQQPNKLTNKLTAHNNKLWTPLLERDKAKSDITLSSIAEGGQTNVSTSPGSLNAHQQQVSEGSRPPLGSLTSSSSSLPGGGGHHTNEVSFDVEEVTSPNITVTRSPLLELKGHTGTVIGAGWIAGGGMVATASWDHSVRLWSVDNADRPVSAIPAGHEKPHRITHLSSQPVSPLVVFSSTDGAFRVWDTRNNSPQAEAVFGHQGPVTSCILSHDGTTIVSSSDDRTVKIWDARNIKAPRSAIRCHAAVNKISISPITSTLLIPTDERRATIFDVNGVCRGKLHHQEKFGHKYMISSTAWSSDESVVYTTGFDRKVIAWAKELVV